LETLNLYNGGKNAEERRLILLALAREVRQLGDVRRNPSHLIFAEQNLAADRRLGSSK
jgi:hypothetical protein